MSTVLQLTVNVGHPLRVKTDYNPSLESSAHVNKRNKGKLWTDKRLALAKYETHLFIYLFIYFLLYIKEEGGRGEHPHPLPLRGP